jgi:hypothetical protein
MDFLQVSDPALHKLSSLFELAPHKGKLAVVKVEPDEVGALVRHESIIVGSELDRALLNARKFILQLMSSIDCQKIVVFVLSFHLHEFVLVDGLTNNAQPFVRFAKILNRYDQELRIIGKKRQFIGNHLWSLPGQYVYLHMLKANKLLLALF